jgi:hypothetical protein
MTDVVSNAATDDVYDVFQSVRTTSGKIPQRRFQIYVTRVSRVFLQESNSSVELFQLQLVEYTTMSDS